VVWHPSALSGQVSGTPVHGSVVDTLSGDPVQGALLRFDTGQDVKTGQDGSFSVSSMEAGIHAVAIVTAGCRVSFASFEVDRSRRTSLIFRVGVAEVGGSVVPPDPLPGSKVISSRDIEGMRVGTMAELLGRVAPKLIQSVSGQPGGLPRITSRGVASAQGPISPLLIVDGVNMGSLETPDALDSVRPADIAYLELFEGAVGGWSYGTGGSGGVIRVTTKRGGSISPPGSDLSRCPIPRWR
jgi:iron complex outermembrane receptor protein